MNNIFRKIVNYLFKMYTELQNFVPQTNNMNGSNSDMSGVWYKTHPQFNGPDVLHVRDAIMDGNDMIVITDHGNMSMGEFANNYFKQSDTEYDLEGNEIINTATKPKLPLDSIPKPSSTPKPNLPISNTSNIHQNKCTYNNLKSFIKVEDFLFYVKNNVYLCNMI